MRTSLACVLAAIIAAFAGGYADASIIVYGTQTDHPIVPGGSLQDIQMTVDLMVSGGVATMYFMNTSQSPETSAVIKEIVVDLYDDDLAVNGAVLWDPVLPADTPQVAFTMGDSNGLPGYESVTNDSPPLLELQAKSPPPTKGLGIGETLAVTFSTSLPDGPERIADYLAFFDGGSDTAHYALGFHAISASTVNGESLSGIYTVPEPGTMALVAVAGAVLLARRKRR